MVLSQKKILLILSGGIAAYKIQILIRMLLGEGANVRVVLTPAAKHFVTPLTLSTLSRSKVLVDFHENGLWNNHVDIALWAEVILVAPCTANTLSKMVHGICDNLALAVYMSAKCPVFIAPSMDLDMYKHPSTRQNLDLAEGYGHFIIPAEEGILASGLEGQGRMAEPETLFKHLSDFFRGKERKKTLLGKTVLITAGPTYEAIDPVRFIGNHSSGKMGYALAETAAERGAGVILVSGPSQEKLRSKHNINLISVVSAKEMYDAVFSHYDAIDIGIASAAVADYTPKKKFRQKIKKTEESLSIEFIKNTDILKAMGEQKRHQFLIGFALEMENEEENAREKLKKKNLDMIVLNSLRNKGSGFGEETNKVKIISKENERSYSLKSKILVAQDILNFAENLIYSS
ncbi:MAG: bifunctional phosphopantothenoylcysteine decarboxylase/phosphopantothenate--cysteine ligase CoaBC [Bergeyella sp.]|nr:bifunctional phosphopantothenoylcysteine decarboxylase/phosphopantothenate--cysteine ligase CoaBC [Bergeyella sp.]